MFSDEYCEIFKTQNDLWLYVLVMSRTRFRVNPHYSCLNVKELLARNRGKIWSLSDSNGTRTHNNLVHKRTLNHLAKLAKMFIYELNGCAFESSCSRIKWLILVFFGESLKKILSYLKSALSYKSTVNFGIEYVFSKSLGSAFSEGTGPGPLYKLCLFLSVSETQAINGSSHLEEFF